MSRKEKGAEPTPEEQPEKELLEDEGKQKAGDKDQRVSPKEQ